jgi:hypothetical protein
MLKWWAACPSGVHIPAQTGGNRTAGPISWMDGLRVLEPQRG